MEVHPQLNNNGHTVDGVLVGAGSLWPWHSTWEGVPKPQDNAQVWKPPLM